jgi:hypothetical protein
MVRQQMIRQVTGPTSAAFELRPDPGRLHGWQNPHINPEAQYVGEVWPPARVAPRHASAPSCRAHAMNVPGRTKLGLSNRRDPLAPGKLVWFKRRVDRRDRDSSPFMTIALRLWKFRVTNETAVSIEAQSSSTEQPARVERGKHPVSATAATTARPAFQVGTRSATTSSHGGWRARPAGRTRRRGPIPLGRFLWDIADRFADLSQEQHARAVVGTPPPRSVGS